MIELIPKNVFCPNLSMLYFNEDYNSRDDGRISDWRRKSAHYPYFFEFSEMEIVHNVSSPGCPPVLHAVPSAIMVHGN